MTWPKKKQRLHANAVIALLFHVGDTCAASVSRDVVGRLDHVNTIIELHDSKVAELMTRNGTVIVHFLLAYLHKSEGHPGVDSGTVWVQEARFILEGGSVSGVRSELPCDVIDGELIVGIHRYDNEIPVPLNVTAPAQLRLIYGLARTLTVAASGVRLELLGEPKYVEDFPA
jgi:hypothetical protein